MWLLAGRGHLSKDLFPIPKDLAAAVPLLVSAQPTVQACVKNITKNRRVLYVADGRKDGVQV